MDLADVVTHPMNPYWNEKRERIVPPYSVFGRTMHLLKNKGIYIIT